MSRLTHSPLGYLRYMQMSRNQVFIFVEGRNNDRYFYGELCQPVCAAKGIEYQLSIAEELPGGTGGKIGLSRFFHFLKRKRALLDNFKGKTTVSIFFLDKDVDDRTRKQLRSEHVIYTQHYSVENYLFVEGDLIEAVAIGSSLDSATIQGIFDNQSAWMLQTAVAWKEWAILCLFASLHKLNCDCSYGVMSRINDNTHGALNTAEYQKRLVLLEGLLGRNHKSFVRSFARLYRSVELVFRSDNYNLIFPGKWYFGFLQKEILNLAAIYPIDTNAFLKRFEGAILSTLDFDAVWTKHFREPLSNLVEKI